MPLAAFPKCFLDHLCVDQTMTVDQWIRMADDIDIDGLEFYWGFTPWQSERELDRIRAIVEERGRCIPMMCYSPDFTKPNEAERRAEVARQQRAVRVSARLGATYCRVLSGQRRPDVSIDQGLDWVSSCIQQVLPVAQEVGVTLILENHYKDGYWQYPEFAQKTDIFLALLDRLGDPPCFGVNYDPSNTLIAGEDPVALLEAVKDRVVTMHASDRYLEGGTLEDLRRMETEPSTGYAGILKHGIIGRGLNDYDTIFSILRDAGFTGWISIEDGQDPDVGMEHLRLSADFLRGKMAEYGLP